MVRDLIRNWRPEAVLIEGPADFNPQLHELLLPHRLPVAIYSHVRLADGARRGAYYPFCVYSPEWQAVTAAHETGAAARFIDLPWASQCRDDPGGGAAPSAQRYAEPQLRYSQYVKNLCAAMGVDDFDALWDELFEADPGLSADEYLTRAGLFCSQARALEHVSIHDRRREAFMARELLRAMEEFPGRILVVTGGFHTPALLAALMTPEPAAPVPDGGAAPEPAGCEAGIALTPYSYERLDRLIGYDAGMPNPGFYHCVWRDRSEDRPFHAEAVLAAVVAALRRRKQCLSAADAIACLTAARTLAAIRGHADVWRRDLIDAMRGSLIKDEVTRGGTHPLLDAIAEVFRGDARGRLAEGTSLPPLVRDVMNRLEAHQLTPTGAPCEIMLDLADAAARDCSRLLHLMQILEIPGFLKADGTDLTLRQDLASVWERWEITWSPDLNARIIEASRYGANLLEAAAAALAERMDKHGRDFAAAAAMLVEAALAGLGAQSGTLCARLEGMLKDAGDFFAVATALGHFMFLHSYDHVLELERREQLGPLLRETAMRGLWLLESHSSQNVQDDQGLLPGIQRLLDAFERCHDRIGLRLDDLVDVLLRVERDPAQGPLVRGAAVGVLWTLRRADPEQVLSDLRLFADPNRLGDFLSGLFALAREPAQRELELLRAIDARLCSFSDEEFLLAAPSLRLAYTFFTPREKHHLAGNLLRLSGEPPAGQLPPASPALMASPETALRALAFESRLSQTLNRYGIRQP